MREERNVEDEKPEGEAEDAPEVITGYGTLTLPARGAGDGRP